MIEWNGVSATRGVDGGSWRPSGRDTKKKARRSLSGPSAVADGIDVPVRNWTSGRMFRRRAPLWREDRGIEVSFTLPQDERN
jgi:hypothetical protein